MCMIWPGLIAETMSIHTVATELMETDSWDLAAIYFAGIDHFSHRFMRYHAGKTVRGFDTDPRIYQGIVANAYRYHDLMLGRMLELAGPDCAVMLVSDHGFHSGRLLPDYIPAEAAGPAVEHRHFGIFCLRAPDVLKGERVYGGSVLDIAPTVLHIFGLPAGADMDGKPLHQRLPGYTLPPPIPSWEDVPGEDGRHDPRGRRWRRTRGIPEAAYRPRLHRAPGDDARKTVEECVMENRYNLARSHMEAGGRIWRHRYRASCGRADPDQGRFHQQLIYHFLQQGDYAAAASRRTNTTAPPRISRRALFRS